MKVIRPQVLPDSDEVRRRGQWLVRIDHPALVRVTRGGRFTAGALAGWGFVEMDLVKGEPPPIRPIVNALHLLEPVAEGLDLLHAGAWSDGVPLVHRDVKPGNLLVTDSGLVLVDPSTMRGLDTTDLTRVGTPAYLAPEVVTGRFGPLADVYSLAATAAAMLTGTRGAGLAEVIADPEGHGLPAGVVAGLRDAPERRPPTCGAVLTGEGRIPTGLLGDVAPLEWVPEDGPRQPRWPLLALGLIVGVPAVAWPVVGQAPAGQAPGTQLPAGLDGPFGVVVAVSVLAHLLVHVVTGRAELGLLAPPWAWGDLLAGLDDPDDRRGRWTADVIAGLLVLGVGAVVALVSQGAPPWLVPVVAGATVAGVAIARRAGAVSGRAGRAVVWVLGLPAWLLGALPRVLVSGGRR